ncbi:hypothetical protein [Duganella sp. LjRoot269]|uniref:hypothetical protein n=1 Tax=Duganella sp. LjRoot269 TaxID=3342305 RepID=UPI003ECC5ACD
MRARAWCWPASVPRRAGGACAPAAADLVLQLKEAPAGAELVEQVGQQLVMAVASAALRAPAAIGDLAVIRCWRWRGAGGGRPAAGVCPGVVLASVGTAARRRRGHGGRRRPGAAAEGGAGRAVGAGGPAAGVCPGVVLASVGTAAPAARARLRPSTWCCS